jgi:hypothetical protein
MKRPSLFDKYAHVAFESPYDGRPLNEDLARKFTSPVDDEHDERLKDVAEGEGMIAPE